jgi:hypothetical protein
MMRTLFVKWMVGAILIALVLPAPAIAQAPYLVGNYALYREGDLGGKVVGYMRISSQQGNRFTIGISVPTGNPTFDWQGNGEVMGNRGSYSWKFQDGKQGRTTFTIDKAGNLHGHVLGSGLNWQYVARRQ